MNEKITKTDLAKKLGISRPTLDRYLERGFPNIGMYKDTSLSRNKIEIENEIRLLEYDLMQLQEKLKDINKKLENETEKEEKE